MADQSEAAEATLEDLNPYAIARTQFDLASCYLPHLITGLIESFKCPRRTLTVHFPVQTQDGEVRTFTGHRVLHSSTRGPGKGGRQDHHSHGAGDLPRIRRDPLLWNPNARILTPPRILASRFTTLRSVNRISC